MIALSAEETEFFEKGGPSVLEDCEFCDELKYSGRSRFRQIYGMRYHNRILFEKKGLVAFPTLGQLFAGSLLILPRKHFETMAELPSRIMSILPSMLGDLEKRIAEFGRPVLFEHGAKCKTGNGCGIYHAHLHLVPTPGEIHCEEVIPNIDWTASSLMEAYDRLRGSEHYLLFRDVTGVFAAVEPKEEVSPFYPSQYFRRMLSEHFAINAPWDWREYNYQEIMLMQTLECFGVSNVHFCGRNL